MPSCFLLAPAFRWSACKLSHIAWFFFFSFFLPWKWTRPEWTSSPGQASYLGLAWGKTYDRWLCSHCVKVSHKLLCHTIALALPLPRAKIGEEQHLQSHVLHLRCWSQAKTTLCPFPLAFLFHPISVDAQMHSLSAPSTHTQIVYCVCIYIYIYVKNTLADQEWNPKSWTLYFYSYYDF